VSLLPIDPLGPLPGEVQELVSAFRGVEIVTVPVPQLSDADSINLAWDVALYGETSLDKVLTSYGIDPESGPAVLEALTERNRLYAQEYKNAQRALSNDPNVGTKRMARAYLIESMPILGELARSQLVDPSARIKAVEKLAALSGALETPKESGAGVAVQINFGGAMGERIKKAMIHGD